MQHLDRRLGGRVATRGGGRVVDVGEDGDPRKDRNLLAGQRRQRLAGGVVHPRRVAAAVETLVVVEHHLGRRRRHAPLDHLIAQRRVPLHHAHFFGRQPAGLVQYFRGDAHLADVVQQTSQAQQVQVLGLLRRLVVVLVDEEALQFHPQQQRQVADVGGVRHQVVVEGVELLQEDVAAGLPLRKLKRAMIEDWKWTRSISAAVSRRMASKFCRTWT